MRAIGLFFFQFIVFVGVVAGALILSGDGRPAQAVLLRSTIAGVIAVTITTLGKKWFERMK